MADTLYYTQEIKTEMGEEFSMSVMVYVKVWESGTIFIELYDEDNAASLDRETVAATTGGFVCMQISARTPSGCTTITARFGVETVAADTTDIYYAKLRCLRDSAPRVSELLADE